MDLPMSWQGHRCMQDLVCYILLYHFLDIQIILEYEKKTSSMYLCTIKIEQDIFSFKAFDLTSDFKDLRSRLQISLSLLRCGGAAGSNLTVG